ncbi:MAG TPA: transcription antitermination factor NusB, partial [bacterium]|nr:transcription antitermination factor NusB [bacterium]
MLYPSKERIISFNILQAVSSGKKLDEQISLLASHETRKNQIFNLCYGVVRYNNKLELYIRSKAKKAVSKRTNIILKLSLYELAYNNSSKPYAVISEALKLMDYLKETGAKPFVNAILSGFLRGAEKEKKILDSYPWFPEHINIEIKKVFLDNSKQVIDNLNSIKPFFLLVNENKISIKELHERLIAEGIEVEIIEYKGVNSIKTFDRKIFNSKEFEQGYFVIQDLSSQCAV